MKNKWSPVVVALFLYIILLHPFGGEIIAGLVSQLICETLLYQTADSSV